MSRVLLDQIRTIFRGNDSRTFLIEIGNRAYTYGEFERACWQTVKMLQTHGVGRGDRVALLLANSVEFAALYFACIFIGATAVPISKMLHKDEVRFIIVNARPKLLVFSMCTRPVVMSASAGLAIPRVRILLGQEKVFHPSEDDVWALEGAETMEPMDLPGDDENPFLILYTSGTTGRAKAVCHSIRGEFGNAKAFNEFMGFGAQHRFHHIWPMSYSSGVLNTFLSPFMAQGSVVLCPPFKAQTALTFWRPVIENHANVLWLSPAMVAALNRMDRDADGLRYCRSDIDTICVGTAPLTVRLKQEFEQKYQKPLFESYGLSELLILFGNSKRSVILDGSVGQPLPGVKTTIRDEKNEELSVEKTGEIYVETPYAMLGYLDELTGELQKQSEKCFATGDIGRLDKNGNLFITDRKKDIIIRGGLNISPRKISEIIQQHPSVDEVATIGVPNDFYGEEIVAVIRFKTGSSLAEEQQDILKICRERLNSASVPSRLFEIDQFPTGVTGKILVSELRQWVQSRL